MENISNNKNKKIAIIGAGISGLISAKYALENGFTDITIFDKKKVLGGNWNEEKSPMWQNLTANLCKFCMQFSDFVWQEHDEVFAGKKQVINFINKYADNFDLKKYIKYETKVLKISRISKEDKESYRISVQHKEEEPESLIFDYCVIGVGFLTYPDYAVFEKFIKPETQVEFIHASQFKDANYFKNKRVIVIGQAHSSTQIAVKLSKCAKEVLNVFRKPSHIIPKRMYCEKLKKEVPYTFKLFNFKVQTEEESIAFSKLPEKELIKRKNNAFNDLLFPHFDGKGHKYNENYNNVPDILRIEKDCETLMAIGITNGFYRAIHKGTIKPIKSEIKEVVGKNVELTNGDIYEDVDAVILGTGYKCDLNFLDDELKEIINYQFDNKYAPTNTVLDVFHPSLKNLAFVGIHYFLIFGIYELQARLAFKYFSHFDEITKTKNELCMSGLSQNKPYDFINYINKCAMLMNAYPNLDEIKREDEELYNCITEGPLLMQTFYLNTEEKEKYANYIKRVNRNVRSDNKL